MKGFVMRLASSVGVGVGLALAACASPSFGQTSQPLMYGPKNGRIAGVSGSSLDGGRGGVYGVNGRGAIHMPVEFEGLRPLEAPISGIPLFEHQTPFNFPMAECSNTESYSSANFSGGQFVAQAGFSDGEIAAVSYTLPASAFPIRFVSAEAIFATVGATSQTTTEWSVLIWEGTPANGTLVAEFSSDDIILPHLVLGPGNAGANINVIVDPGDPDQIFIFNTGGSNTFSVGYRIDKHNQPSPNPCSVAPDSQRNAFPTTDNNGLSQASQNWLFGLNCGPLGCPSNGGWSTFADLFFFCRPTGDWNIRATWESVNCSPDLGACCLTDGSCLEAGSADCATLGGTFQGDGTQCAGTQCPLPTQACCFEVTNGCLDLDPTQCTQVGGFPQGAGTLCSTTICFPIGAACLPDGSCVDGVSPEEAALLGGTFRGDGTTCATTNCPAPTGASCFPNGACLVLTQAQATLAGATWAGPGTTCADLNANGTADACEAACVGDIADDFGTLGSDDQVSFGDFLALLGLIGPCPGGTPGCTGDIADDFGTVGGDGQVSFGDFLALLGLIGPCP